MTSPSWKPIIVAMKSTEGGFVDNALKYGVAGLNIDACRIETDGKARLLREVSGDIVSSDDSGHKYGKRAFGSKAIGTTTQGRWPANLIHDGSDEVMELFPESLSRPVKPENVGISGDNHKGKLFVDLRSKVRSAYYDSESSAARFFYTAKDSLSLFRYLIKLCKTPTGGVLLNPFHDDTIATACVEENQEFISIGETMLIKEWKKGKLYQGDALEVMKSFEDNSIDSIVTDPPYALTDKSGNKGFMGKEWDKGIPGIPYWREMLRVAKPGAHLFAMGGTRTHHRLMCAIEDAGWEIRDCINYLHDGSQEQKSFWNSLDDNQKQAYLNLHHPNQTRFWIQGQGFSKGLNISKKIDERAGVEREVVGISPFASRRPNPLKGNTYNYNKENYDISQNLNLTKPATPEAELWSGWNTNLKPSFEIIVIAMKSLDGGFVDNALKWNVAGLNIDECRIETKDNLSGGTYSGQKRDQSQNSVWQNNDRTDGQGSGFRSGIGEFNQPSGRWPANLILSYPEDEYELRDDITSTQLRQLAEWIDENPNVSIKAYDEMPSEIQSLFVKCYNPGKEEVVRLFPETKSGGSGNDNDNGRGIWGNANRRVNNVIPINEGSAARFFYTAKPSPSEKGSYNNHETVKPLSLFKWIVRLCKTPTGGVVLDPFCGSGTTALACIEEGREFIMIDKDYIEISQRRIDESLKEVINVPLF